MRLKLSPEAASGLLLMFASALAIVLANSPLAEFYDLLLNVRGAILINGVGLEKPLLLWIDEGLMALFFLLVGLEIKRELVAGALSDRRRAILPVAAAAGGMAVPGLVYIACAWHVPDARSGWAIPAATDIAFALGVVSLLGSRVPASLKLLLAALAVIDDLGSIVIIAIFYTSSLSLVSLCGAAAALVVLFGLNLFGVRQVTWYVLVGIALWTFVLKSGVHATLAGVALAFAIPYAAPEGEPSPLHRVEHALQPWVAFGILPLFGFANAGFSFVGMSLSDLFQPIPLGVAAGLFIGKQLGVFGAVSLVVRRGWAALPEGASWRCLYGISVLTGIGFTMSLFIGTLAFGQSGNEAAMRLGVLVGSVLSGVVGVAVLLSIGAARATAEEGSALTSPDD
jgi:Na+:H+ antiporter, NhaA family